MRKRIGWKLAAIFMAVSLNPISAYAGTWENTSAGYQYQKDDGNYARAEWITENGISYYLNQNGIMAADGSWVTETQVTGGYVRTPYDNRPYRYDPKWQIYVFDTTSEYDKDEITKRAVYNWSNYTQEDDEVYSILINGTGKCVGFARAYKLLANAVGLKCEFRENGAHMWNAVYVDGIAKSIDTSETRTDVEFYLGTVADEAYSGGQYEAAQSAYVTAKERSRYADRIADGYIDGQLSRITDYLSVFDYIQLGDTLAAQGDYERAEEKYLQAKSLATRTYFEDGRKEAMDAMEAMYSSRDKAEEADTQEAKEKASNETGAAQLASDGDKAFAEGDYEGAKAYYAMALEKYQQLGDTAHAELIQTKIDSSGQKSEENKQKEQQAESYVSAGREQELAGDKLEAKKQYLFAKNIYKELKKDDKVTEVDGLIEVLDTAIEQEEKKKSESLEAESVAAAETNSSPETTSNMGEDDREIGPGIN